jgi:hypothetical protein
MPSRCSTRKARTACGTDSRQERAAPHHASTSTTAVFTSLRVRRLEPMAAALETPCEILVHELGDIAGIWIVEDISKSVISIEDCTWIGELRQVIRESLGPTPVA